MAAAAAADAAARGTDAARCDGTPDANAPPARPDMPPRANGMESDSADGATAAMPRRWAPAAADTVGSPVTQRSSNCSGGTIGASFAAAVPDAAAASAALGSVAVGFFAAVEPGARAAVDAEPAAPDDTDCGTEATTPATCGRGDESSSPAAPAESAVDASWAGWREPACPAVG